VPIPAAVKAFRKLVDERGHTRLPVAFVTNSLNRNVDRANQLSAMLGVQVRRRTVLVDMSDKYLW
jgi:ribonucleotide monophosphatase NagD (HAD superfamily)